KLLHDSLIILHEQMLDEQLSPVGQNLGEPSRRFPPGNQISTYSDRRAMCTAAITCVRSPTASNWTRKKFASRSPKANWCARTSPLQAQNRVLECSVLHRSGAPEEIRTLTPRFVVCCFPVWVDHFMLECPQTEQQPYPEMTGIRPRFEQYCEQSGHHRCSRSCPAGLVAEVGLRWWRHEPPEPNGGSQCRSPQRNE